MGDEVRRTQDGNNNAYCQNNELSWFNWNDPVNHKETLNFVKKIIQFKPLELVMVKRYMNP